MMKEYTVWIAGLPHTMQYEEETAKALGLELASAKAAPKPQNRARAARNKAVKGSGA